MRGKPQTKRYYVSPAVQFRAQAANADARLLKLLKHARRQACLSLCRSGKYETGEGTCALICVGQPGSPRTQPQGCAHVEEVFQKEVDRLGLVSF